MKYLKKQQGAALLVVLLILAVMVIVASRITVKYNSEFLRTRSFLAGIQANWMDRGSDELVRRVLNQDFSDNSESTNLSQYWATQGRSFDTDDGGTITTYVHDAYACFNLNALSNDEYVIKQENGEKLNLANLYLRKIMEYMQVDPDDATIVADSITDMVDMDSSPRDNGAEDAYYRALRHPFVIPNGQLYDVSEIRQVRGMTPGIYRRLRPFVCALNNNSLKINVNTIILQKAPLLAALLLNDNLTLDDAASVIRERSREGWNSAGSFMSADIVKDMITDQTRSFISRVAVVKSDYFMSQTEVDFDGLVRSYQSFFYRSGTQAYLYQRIYGGTQ
ncbi:MAG: type II secretion system minor pseudopilin GspK [Succinivibrionaceae bacterium]